MSRNEMSAAQYGSVQAQSANYGTPLAGSSSTYGSVGAKTAWTTSGIGGATPAPLSRRTSGSTLKWDDDSSTPSLPQADAGASYLMGG